MEDAFERAKKLLADEKYEEAAAAFRGVAEKMPKYKAAWENMAFALVCAGDIDGAIVAYSEIAKRHPRDHEAFYRRAVLELKAGRAADALSSVRRALLLSPTDAEYLYTQGCIFYAMNDLNAAIASFGNALDSDPYHYPAADHLCQCLFGLGSYDELAAFCLRSIEMYEPFVPGDFERLSENALPETKPPTSLDGFGSAQLARFYNYLSLSCLKAGAFEDAVRFLNTELSFDPENKSVLYYLGLASDATGKHLEAAAIFEKVLALDPAFRNARTNLAQSLSKAGDAASLARAVDIFEQICDDEPENTAAAKELGRLLRRAGRPDDALCVFSRIIERSPSDLSAYRDAAEICFDAGSHEKAADLLEKICSLDPFDSDAFNMLAVSYMHLNMPEKAGPLFRKAAELDPLSPKAYYNEGIAHLKSDAFEEAASCLRTAAEKAPGDASVFYYLGIALTKCCLYEDAATAFEKVRALDPGNADAEKCLAFVKEKTETAE